jgi:hypothetical protein
MKSDTHVRTTASLALANSGWWWHCLLDVEQFDRTTSWWQIRLYPSHLFDLDRAFLLVMDQGKIILLDQLTDQLWIIFYWKDGNQIEIAAPYCGLQKTEHNAGSCIFYLSSEFL